LPLSKDELARLQRLVAAIAQRETERAIQRLTRRYDELMAGIEPLRRQALDQMVRGDLAGAEATLNLMDRYVRRWMGRFRGEEYQAILDIVEQAAIRGAQSVDILPVLYRHEHIDPDRLWRALESASHGAGGRVDVAYGRIAAGVQQQIARRIYQDGLSLSRRLHTRLAENAREFNRILATGLRQGRSAVAIATELQKLNVTDPKVPKYLRDLEAVLKGTKEGRLADEIRRAREQAFQRKEGPLGIRGVSRRVVEAARSGSAERLDEALGAFLERKARYHAVVIARTEAQNAFRAAHVDQAKAVDWVVGIKWNLSSGRPSQRWHECDEYAVADHGMGPGVWPKDQLPERPHPSCMCYFTDVVDVERLRRAG